MDVFDSVHTNGLRELLAEAGWSFDQAATAVRGLAAEHDRQLRTNSSAIAHWVTGRAVPLPTTAAFLAEALSRKLKRKVHVADLGFARNPDQKTSVMTSTSATLDPVTEMVEFGRAMNRRDVLGGIVFSLAALAVTPQAGAESAARAHAARRASASIGWPEVDSVREITAAFHRADERLGGGAGRSTLVHYLTNDVAGYCSARSSAEVRKEMFSSAAQLAYLLGWKAHDIGEQGVAQRWYLQSLKLAEVSGDDAHAAYIMRILVHQVHDMGLPEGCVDLAEAARTRAAGRVDPDTASLFELTAARAYAKVGDRTQTLISIRRAEQLAGRAGDDQRPAWASSGPAPARLSNQTGKALASLGDLTGAAEHFAQSAQCWDRITHPRIWALTMADLAEVQCRAGKIDQACANWSAALNAIPGIRSARTAAAVKVMRTNLSPYRRRVPAAAALLDRTSRP